MTQPPVASPRLRALADRSAKVYDAADFDYLRWIADYIERLRDALIRPAPAAPTTEGEFTRLLTNYRCLLQIQRGVTLRELDAAREPVEQYVASLRTERDALREDALTPEEAEAVRRAVSLNTAASFNADVNALTTGYNKLKRIASHSLTGGSDTGKRSAHSQRNDEVDGEFG